jgi:hypothetical protein
MPNRKAPIGPQHSRDTSTVHSAAVTGLLRRPHNDEARPNAIGGFPAKVSGAEEHEPDRAQDQYCETRRDSEEGKHRRAGFALACFGRDFDDLIMSSRCHGALDSLMSLKTPVSSCGIMCRRKRMIPDDVPGFRAPAMPRRSARRSAGQRSCRLRLTPPIPDHAVPTRHG